MYLTYAQVYMASVPYVKLTPANGGDFYIQVRDPNKPYNVTKFSTEGLALEDNWKPTNEELRQEWVIKYDAVMRIPVQQQTNHVSYLRKRVDGFIINQETGETIKSYKTETITQVVEIDEHQFMLVSGFSFFLCTEFVWYEG